ncbi:LysR family transcriptional regulator [Amycolatopsis jiangsuensis]|uniref:DNA-binding transcriptional LysR family regulator n=1 Tax=Amycolatopsis jiangsuensis TaxID=1181879 RepID=A0A840IWP5_9PSEU|nr:LysR family transcriptional regulator [Amycolatopsis jiangsuensis]MBB4685578.1 DNA-binding transcriptional LysR family regulator [Amycolatopsis jiangsuensis]
MELRALRYFVTVAEELHFGRAAERLHIVQPAVSQQVARLERELGVRLLDRSPRTVRLTDAGNRVLAAAREALQAVDRVRAAAGPPTGTIRIGTVPGLAARLQRGIDTLRRLGPSFETVLVDLPLPERLAALRRGDLDLALARGVTQAEGLRVSLAWTEPLHAVVSVRHPAANRRSVRLTDLTEEVLRLPSPRSDPALHEAVKTALREVGFTPREGRPLGTVEDTMVELGVNWCSWALLPAGQVSSMTGTVRALPLDPPLEIRGTVLVLDDGLTDQCLSPVVDAFRDPAALAHPAPETADLA